MDFQRTIDWAGSCEVPPSRLISTKVTLTLIPALLVLAVIYYAYDMILTFPLGILSLASLIGAMTIVLATVPLSESKGWSPATTYIAMITLFHFGASGIYGLGWLSAETEAKIRIWFFHDRTREAIVLSFIGVLACYIGILAAHVSYRPASGHEVRHNVEHHSDFDGYLSMLGSIMVVAAVLLWFFNVISSGGPSLLIGSYRGYLDATAGTPMEYVWMGLGFGLSFLASTDGKGAIWARNAAKCCFILFVVFALPLGLRGEVMFATLTVLVIRAKRGRRLSWKATLAGVIAVLMIISVIEDLRQVGLGQYESDQVSGNMLDGVTELGSTLRPVVVVLGWEANGEEPIKGASYWAPIDRALCRMVPDRTCVPARQDDRLMNVLASNRVGGIGFSPIAEAVRNFGKLGPVVSMSVIGMVVGSLTKAPGTPLSNAVTGVILTELFINVRNAFTPIPSHLLLGLCLLAAVHWVSRSRYAPDKPATEISKCK